MPVNPALQKQAMTEILPTAEVDPVGQNEHACEPAAVLNVPATQGKQIPPLGPVKPASHSQAPSAALPIAEIELSGHSAQSDDDIWNSHIVNPFGTLTINFCAEIGS